MIHNVLAAQACTTKSVGGILHRYRDIKVTQLIVGNRAVLVVGIGCPNELINCIGAHIKMADIPWYMWLIGVANVSTWVYTLVVACKDSSYRDNAE